MTSSGHLIPPPTPPPMPPASTTPATGAATEAAAEDEPAAKAPRRLYGHRRADLALDLFQTLVERTIDCDHDQRETDADAEDANQ